MERSQILETMSGLKLFGIAPSRARDAGSENHGRQRQARRGHCGNASWSDSKAGRRSGDQGAYCLSVLAAAFARAKRPVEVLPLLTDAFERVEKTAKAARQPNHARATWEAA